MAHQLFRPVGSVALDDELSMYRSVQVSHDSQLHSYSVPCRIPDGDAVLHLNEAGLSSRYIIDTTRETGSGGITNFMVALFNVLPRLHDRFELVFQPPFNFEEAARGTNSWFPTEQALADQISRVEGTMVLDQNTNCWRARVDEPNPRNNKLIIEPEPSCRDGFYVASTIVPYRHKPCQMRYLEHLLLRILEFEAQHSCFDAVAVYPNNSNDGVFTYCLELISKRQLSGKKNFTRAHWELATVKRSKDHWRYGVSCPDRVADVTVDCLPRLTLKHLAPPKQKKSHSKKYAALDLGFFRTDMGPVSAVTEESPVRSLEEVGRQNAFVLHREDDLRFDRLDYDVELQAKEQEGENSSADSVFVAESVVSSAIAAAVVRSDQPDTIHASKLLGLIHSLAAPYGGKSSKAMREVVLTRVAQCIAPFVDKDWSVGREAICLALKHEFEIALCVNLTPDDDAQLHPWTAIHAKKLNTARLHVLDAHVRRGIIYDDVRAAAATLSALREDEATPSLSIREPMLGLIFASVPQPVEQFSLSRIQKEDFKKTEALQQQEDVRRLTMQADAVEEVRVEATRSFVWGKLKKASEWAPLIAVVCFTSAFLVPLSITAFLLPVIALLWTKPAIFVAAVVNLLESSDALSDAAVRAQDVGEFTPKGVFVRRYRLARRTGLRGKEALSAVIAYTTIPLPAELAAVASVFLRTAVVFDQKRKRGDSISLFSLDGAEVLLGESYGQLKQMCRGNEGSIVGILLYCGLSQLFCGVATDNDISDLMNLIRAVSSELEYPITMPPNRESAEGLGRNVWSTLEQARAIFDDLRFRLALRVLTDRELLSLFNLLTCLVTFFDRRDRRAFADVDHCKRALSAVESSLLQYHNTGQNNESATPLIKDLSQQLIINRSYPVSGRRDKHFTLTIVLVLARVLLKMRRNIEEHLYDLVVGPACDIKSLEQLDAIASELSTTKVDLQGRVIGVSASHGQNVHIVHRTHSDGKKTTTRCFAANVRLAGSDRPLNVFVFPLDLFTTGKPSEEEILEAFKNRDVYIEVKPQLNVVLERSWFYGCKISGSIMRDPSGNEVYAGVVVLCCKTSFDFKTNCLRNGISSELHYNDGQPVQPYIVFKKDNGRVDAQTITTRTEGPWVFTTATGCRDGDCGSPIVSQSVEVHAIHIGVVLRTQNTIARRLPTLHLRDFYGSSPRVVLQSQADQPTKAQKRLARLGAPKVEHTHTATVVETAPAFDADEKLANTLAAAAKLLDLAAVNKQSLLKVNGKNVLNVRVLPGGVAVKEARGGAWDVKVGKLDMHHLEDSTSCLTDLAYAISGKAKRDPAFISLWCAELQRVVEETRQFVLSNGFTEHDLLTEGYEPFDLLRFKATNGSCSSVLNVIVENWHYAVSATMPREQQKLDVQSFANYFKDASGSPVSLKEFVKIVDEAAASQAASREAHLLSRPAAVRMITTFNQAAHSVWKTGILNPKLMTQDVFAKNEPHKTNKVAQGRARNIISSTLWMLYMFAKSCFMREREDGVKMVCTLDAALSYIHRKCDAPSSIADSFIIGKSADQILASLQRLDKLAEPDEQLIGMDFSGWDCSVPAEVLQTLFVAHYGTVGVSLAQGLCGGGQYKIGNLLVTFASTGDGVAPTLWPSGNLLTLVGNSQTNLALQRAFRTHVSGVKAHKKLECLVAGDDCAMVVRKEDISELQPFYKACGMKTKYVEGTIGEDGQRIPIGFCGFDVMNNKVDHAKIAGKILCHAEACKPGKREAFVAFASKMADPSFVADDELRSLAVSIYGEGIIYEVASFDSARAGAIIEDCLGAEHNEEIRLLRHKDEKCCLQAANVTTKATDSDAEARDRREIALDEARPVELVDPDEQERRAQWEDEYHNAVEFLKEIDFMEESEIRDLYGRYRIRDKEENREEARLALEQWLDENEDYVEWQKHMMEEIDDRNYGRRGEV